MLMCAKGFVRTFVALHLAIRIDRQEPMTKYKFATVPSRGEAIVYRNGALAVPDNPIIPFVEGDGTGPDIWRASVRVFDAAVERA